MSVDPLLRAEGENPPAEEVDGLDPQLDDSPLGQQTGDDDPRARIAAIIIAAMAPEIAPFAERSLEHGEPFGVGNAILQTAVLSEQPVLLVHAGIGLVNAASAITAALHRYRPELVVSVGSAGGIRGRARVGDVAVSERLVYSTADAVGFGYAMGQVPGMPTHFRGDAAVLASAVSAHGVVVGPFASGDVFVQGPLLDAVLANFPDALAVDMESTAIAQVCHSHGVRFCSIRGISDLCGPAAEAEHAERVDDVSERAAEVVVRVLRSLRPSAT